MKRFLRIIFDWLNPPPHDTWRYSNEACGWIVYWDRSSEELQKRIMERVEEPKDEKLVSTFTRPINARTFLVQYQYATKMEMMAIELNRAMWDPSNTYYGIPRTLARQEPDSDQFIP